MYPYSEEYICCEPFEIPLWWPRGYALDVGWNRTAALWLAYDRQANICYAYAEYYVGKKTVQEHAWAIKQKGPWIPGVIDPAARQSNQIDGRRLIDLYRAEGLQLTEADNSLHAGIDAVAQRLNAGSLKIFKTLLNLRAEYRMYRYSDKNDGKIVEAKLPPATPQTDTDRQAENAEAKADRARRGEKEPTMAKADPSAQYGDHLLDCLRYGVSTYIPISGYPRAEMKASPALNATPRQPKTGGGELGWMR